MNTSKRLKLNYFAGLSAEKKSLLLIHGWGIDSHVWDTVIDGLRKQFDIFTLDLPGYGRNHLFPCTTVEAFLTQFERDCLPKLPKTFSLIGWSLGGMLASLIAQRHHRHVNALLTVGCNVVFAANDEWHTAMDASDFAGFSLLIREIKTSTFSDQDDRQKAVDRVLRRFDQMQTSGIPTAKVELRRLKSLREKLVKPSAVILENGLNWLEELDLTSCWQALSIPVMHQFGRYDALVPSAVMNVLPQRYPNHQFYCFEYSSHLPFQTETSQWIDKSVSFLIRSWQTD